MHMLSISRLKNGELLTDGITKVSPRRSCNLSGFTEAIGCFFDITATGSKYSLVPTDNSAGNFVKIRQRIPVRIEFDGVPESVLDALRAGMMVEVDAER